MKTTIEVKGYQIIIDETDEIVTVTATKDDETVEEFSLELSEEGVEGVEGLEGEETQDEEGIKSFGDFGGEEEDFGQNEIQDEDEIQDEEEDEIQDEDENESALESFQAFVNKRK